MSSWKKYKLGNGLRGVFFFKARNVREAWKIGCKRFNAAYPTDNSIGRLVCLSEYVETGKIPTTRYIVEQLSLPKEKRYFSNLETPVGGGWIVVADGASKQSLIL